MDVVSKVPGVTGLFISGIISAALRYILTCLVRLNML